MHEPSPQAEEAQIATNEARLRDLRRRRVEEHSRTKKNDKLITARWLFIMREAKSNQLREAATVMAQTHSRTIDRKNTLLQSLEREVDDAETQHRRAVSDHASRVETLLRLHANRARETSDHFASDARLVAEAFKNEELEIKEKHARHRRDMLDVLDAMEKAHESFFVRRRARFETAREEIKSRNAEAFENAKNKLEAAVRACERTCEEAHKTYVSGTDTRAASFEQLTARDSQSARTIESRMRDLGRLARRLRRVKGALESQSREWREKNKALRKEKERVRDHAHALAATTKRGRAEANAKLKALLAGSNGALKSLDARLTHAERILKLAAAARRLETERERVVPFLEEEEEEEEASFEVEALEQLDASFTRERERVDEPTELEDVDEKERAELEDRVGEPLSGTKTDARRDPERSRSASRNVFSTALHSLPEDERLSTGALDTRGFAVDESRYLERFFRRLNKATLDALASSRERERLSAENADLRDIVAGYLNGVTVSDETTRDPNNPLFVVNERVLKAQAQRRDAEAKAEAARNDEQRRAPTSAARKLYNSRRAGARSGGERERNAAAPPVEVFVNANR
jgi:hypothetical protein